MPGRALTPAGKIVKWIVIPIALVAFGFFVVGARIGHFLPGLGAKATEPSQSVADNANPSFSAPDVHVDRDGGRAAPEVEVTARPKPKYRRHREHPVPTEDTNAREPVEDYVPQSGDAKKNPDSKQIGTGA